MNAASAGLDGRLPDLRAEINEVCDRFPNLTYQDGFCAWFVLAYLVDRVEEATKSLTGAPNDKDIDAVWVDENARRAFVIQSKLRQKLMGASEPRHDVIGFAGLASILLGEPSQFTSFVNEVDPLVADRVRLVRDRCTKRGYALDLYYVTTGKFSPGVAKEAEGAVRRGGGGQAQLTLVDGKRVVGLLDDYLDGVAPPVPSVDLPIGVGGGTGIVDHYDSKSDIESWVFTAKGYDVGRLFASAGPRIFARNIRGFLGNTAINTAMEATLENEPQHFLYFNNGVTIVCDEALQEKSKGTSILKISNPQIINGQQTTRMLAREDRRSGRASVLVRVIRIPRTAASQNGTFDQLVSQIVEATNWQNEIRASDLMSNDRQQIVIERGFRKLGYQYLRKRQTKREARRTAGHRTDIVVKKEELAQAVAACELDPAVVREGRETLFADRYYKQVFPSGDPHFYLARYWLMRRVNQRARGTLERTYARWVLLHFLWSDMGGELKRLARQFEVMMEHPRRFPDEVTELERMIERALLAVIKFYRATSGTGVDRPDPNAFFHGQGRADQFEKFWRGSLNPHRRTYQTARDRFLEGVKAVSA
jgi:hypothetical protein